MTTDKPLKLWQCTLITVVVAVAIVAGYVAYRLHHGAVLL